MTPHNFYRLTDLRSHRPNIDLEGELSIHLNLDLLGRTYPSKHIRYHDLKVDY